MFGLGGPEIGILMWFILPGIIGAVIAGRKGRSGLLWFMGCGILPLLVILVAFLKPVESKGKFKRCPFCQEMVRWQAIVCPHCQRDLEMARATASDR